MIDPLNGIKFFIKELSIYFAMIATLIILLIIISPSFLAKFNIVLIKDSLALRQKHLGWLLLMFFICLTYDLAYILKAKHTNHIKRKKEKLKEEQKEKELKEEKERKIQLIKKLAPEQKIILRLIYENQKQRFPQDDEVKDMIEKNILKVVGPINPIGKFAKTMYPVSLKIEYCALEIIRKYPELLYD